MSRASGGRGKRQRFNSGENKGVKVVPRRMLKRGGVITRPQPGGIQAGRPRPTRQVGENPRPLWRGRFSQRVLCGPEGLGRA